MRNKINVFKKWVSTGCLATHLAKSLFGKPFCFHLAHISLETDDIDNSERVFEGVDCELKKDRRNCLCTVSKIASISLCFVLVSYYRGIGSCFEHLDTKKINTCWLLTKSCTPQCSNNEYDKYLKLNSSH